MDETISDHEFGQWMRSWRSICVVRFRMQQTQYFHIFEFRYITPFCNQNIPNFVYVKMIDPCDVGQLEMEHIFENDIEFFCPTWMGVRFELRDETNCFPLHLSLSPPLPHTPYTNLRDHWNLHPGFLQRQQALKPAWLGDRWQHHRQEREDPASRRQAYHSPEESLLSSQSLSVGHVRTGRLVSDEFGSLISNVRENPRRDSENEQIKILLERQKEQIIAVYRAENQKHEFQADYDRRKIQKMKGVIESQRGEIFRALQGDEQHRRDQQLFHEQLLAHKSVSSWSSWEKS